MKAVVTGGTGAIGVALIQKLLRENIEVLVLLHRESQRIENIPASSHVTCEFCSLEDLADYCAGGIGEEEKYDMFFHLGWAGSYGPERNDMAMQCNNIKYTLDAVELASRLRCGVFVGAGSQAEYGADHNQEKLTSNTSIKPDTGYGIAKYSAGRMSRILCSQYGIRHIWTRILSVYGPYDRDCTMVMSTIGKLCDGIMPKCTEGGQIWDYLYSKDAAKALYLAAQKGVDGKTYVIGSGEQKRLRDYIISIKNVVNPDADIMFGAVPYNQNQVMYLSADIVEIQEDTGFNPETSFEEGIIETMDYYKTKTCDGGNAE